VLTTRFTTDCTPTSLTLAGLALLLVTGAAVPAQEMPYAKTVLIHPPIETQNDGQSLTIREHTYREQLLPGDQLASDFGLKQVGRVGNNGNSRAPHVHAGAWKAGDTPLQIQVDLYAAVR